LALPINLEAAAIPRIDGGLRCCEGVRLLLRKLGAEKLRIAGQYLFFN